VAGAHQRWAHRFWHQKFADIKLPTKVFARFEIVNNNPLYDTMPTEPRKELSQWDKGRIEGRSESMMEGEIGRQLHIPQ